MKNKSVNLTNDQWSLLAFYIHLTTQYRKGEAEAWAKLAEETNEDGSPRFPVAKDNANYYKRIDKELKEIAEIIENTY